MKKVSVIIPTYKRSDYLIRAIDSVINQTYNNIEIIVVDDNDENTIYRKLNEKKLCKYIKSNQIIYFKHDVNKNGAAARNTGINICTGDYITFLDDDDFYLKNRVQSLVSALDNNKEYDCAYSSMIKIKNNSIYNYRTANKKGNIIVDVLKQYSFFGTGSNIFFTRKAIESVGNFDENFFRFQDLEYMVRFFEKKMKIYPVKEVLVVKCEEDNMNVPNFFKMKMSKEMYISKFEYLITNYQNEFPEIKYDIYKELYFFSEKSNHKIAKKVLSTYRKIKLKDKLIYIYIRIIKKNSFFEFLNYKFRKIMCLNKYSISEKKEIFTILKKYNKGEII